MTYVYKEHLILNIVDKIARKCEELWPMCVPRDGELWYRAPGSEEDDYVAVIRELFGKTVPTPVSSRWREIDGY